eukprot:superscaffoldBa00002911_g15627
MSCLIGATILSDRRAERGDSCQARKTTDAIFIHVKFLEWTVIVMWSYKLGLSGPSTVVLERDSSRQSWPRSRRAPLTRRARDCRAACFQPKQARPEPAVVLLMEDVCVGWLVGWLSSVSQHDKPSGWDGSTDSYWRTSGSDKI